MLSYGAAVVLSALLIICSLSVGIIKHLNFKIIRYLKLAFTILSVPNSGEQGALVLDLIN